MSKRDRAWMWEWRACAKNRNADTEWNRVPEMYTRAGTSQISIKGTPEHISVRKKLKQIFLCDVCSQLTSELLLTDRKRGTTRKASSFLETHTFRNNESRET
jgi:hypothetical protein